MEKFTKFIKSSNSISITHDSRMDVRTISKLFNELIISHNNLIDEFNRLKNSIKIEEKIVHVIETPKPEKMYCTCRVPKSSSKPNICGVCHCWSNNLIDLSTLRDTKC